MSNAPELIRLASRLTRQDLDAVVLILEVSNPGLSRAHARTVVESLAAAGRKLNSGERPQVMAAERVGVAG